MPHNHINDLFTALSALPPTDTMGDTMRQIIDTAREICSTGDCSTIHIQSDKMHMDITPVVKKYAGLKATFKF